MLWVPGDTPMSYEAVLKNTGNWWRVLPSVRNDGTYSLFLGRFLIWSNLPSADIAQAFAGAMEAGLSVPNAAKALGLGVK